MLSIFTGMNNIKYKLLLVILFGHTGCQMSQPQKSSPLCQKHNLRWGSDVGIIIIEVTEEGSCKAKKPPFQTGAAT